MAMNRVTHSCGCTVDHNICGPIADRGRQVDFQASRACYDCYKKHRDADAVEASVGLPALEGSEKQVSWATSIRAEVIAVIDTRIEKLKTGRTAMEAAGISWTLVEEVIDTLRAERLAVTSAKSWIDNREAAAIVGSKFEKLVAQCYESKLAA